MGYLDIDLFSEFCSDESYLLFKDTDVHAFNVWLEPFKASNTVIDYRRFKF